MGSEVTISAQGIGDVVKSFTRDVKAWDKAFFRKVGVYLRSEFVKSMTSGVGPNKATLPPPAEWTRIAGKGGKGGKQGKMIPLLNTGALRMSMGNVRVTESMLEFGWSGGELRKAESQQQGIAGSMAVRPRAIKGLYSGIRTTKKVKGKDRHQYMRVKNGDRGWITKQVYGGAVRVRPRARAFFYLTDAQMDKLRGFYAQEAKT